MLNRMTKQSRSWNTRDSVVASPIISFGITPEKRRKKKDRGSGYGTLENTNGLVDLAFIIYKNRENESH